MDVPSTETCRDDVDVDDDFDRELVVVVDSGMNDVVVDGRTDVTVRKSEKEIFILLCCLQSLFCFVLFCFALYLANRSTSKFYDKKINKYISGIEKLLVMECCEKKGKGEANEVKIVVNRLVVGDDGVGACLKNSKMQ